MKHSQLALILFATALFAFTVLFDISEFGQNWNNIWSNIDFGRLIPILLIITGFGFYLAVWIQRKKPYTRRLAYSIPIAFILVSLYLWVKIYMISQGTEEEYNHHTAIRDIRNGKIQLLAGGLILSDPDRDKEYEKVYRKYGFESVRTGCIITPGIGKYNEVMEKYLDLVNGKDWGDKMAKELELVDRQFDIQEPENKLVNTAWPFVTHSLEKYGDFQPVAAAMNKEGIVTTFNVQTETGLTNMNNDPSQPQKMIKEIADDDQYIAAVVFLKMEETDPVTKIKTSRVSMIYENRQEPLTDKKSSISYSFANGGFSYGDRIRTDNIKNRMIFLN